MNTPAKIGIIIVLLIMVAGILSLKNTPDSNAVQEPAILISEESGSSAAGLPKLVDLGAGKCIPCKMMAPILDELENSYQGQFDVVFYDVWENPSIAEHYGVRIIPTQIFFDASGNELFRHEGFYSKEDILNKWNELGISFKESENEGN
jgi:thioredoxin 1